MRPFTTTVHEAEEEQTEKRGRIQSDRERAEESGLNVPDDWRSMRKKAAEGCGGETGDRACRYSPK